MSGLRHPRGIARLSTHELEEHAGLYRQGYTQGYGFMMSEPAGQTWPWTWLADLAI